MGNFEFTCPHCKEKFEAQEDWCGMEAECPNCNNYVTINKPSPPILSPVAYKKTEESNMKTTSVAKTQILCYSRTGIFLGIILLLIGVSIGTVIGISFSKKDSNNLQISKQNPPTQVVPKQITPVDKPP
jgi:DNA-directed RNA polymerase subunit RPC12/RpoP